MNKNRRKQITDLTAEIRKAANEFGESMSKARGSFEDLKNQIESIKDEEQEYKDSMPENMQSGEKGDRADTAINAMEEAMSALDEIEEAFTVLDEKPEEVAATLEEIE